MESGGDIPMGILERLGAVSPIVWIVMAITLALGFGAAKWVELMRVPEDKREKAVIIIKCAALLLAILLFILVVTIY
jgi:hypothetical protein